MKATFKISAVLCLLAGFVIAGCQRAPEHPPVILITIDTLRADHVHCYGYFRQTTPVIDSIAADGVLFEKVLTPMATTLPAHVSLMTGISPQLHGIKGNFYTFKTPMVTGEGLQSAAEMFKSLGYTTAAFVSATPVRSATGLAAGFDFFDEPRRAERPAGITTQRILAWLDSSPKEPVFLWIHYFDPHYPYQPPPGFKNQYRAGDGLVSFLRDRGFTNPEEPILAQWNNDYDGEVSYVDSELGKVINKLKALGWYEECAVVITSDHGEGLGQHKWVGHGRIYNEQLFVPLIMKFPFQMNLKGLRRRTMATLMDVFPTLVVALDFPIAERFLSQSGGLNILNEESGHPYVLAQRCPDEPRLGPGKKYALLMGSRWKYFLITEGEDELYDLRADPNEKQNVIAEHPETAREMRERVLAILKDAQERTPLLQKKEVVDPEIQEQLKGLGYGR